VYCDTPEETAKWKTAMQHQIDIAPETKDGENVPYSRPGASSPLGGSPRRTFRTMRSDSWRGEDADVPTLLQELEDLRSEVATLKSEVSLYEKSEKHEEFQEARLGAPRTRARRGSVLEDGTPVALEPREMERMKQIFSLFDVQGIYIFILFFIAF